ncbi:hypothetical protein IAE49_10895 [Kosakonia sp. S58]|uniref:hypothetical protein n=1 Tax=unclassified Kosakonia TaxID=2632876 RepID=UPI0019056A8F|nr:MULTISPECIES: hypothetical protein [unclassified Kosakonia]MBK0079749.1 hypothetical protein [Kosakonia sp. S57]MBK0086741.1 hypothetical protein [Kosakonia sp. S58]
MKLPQWFSWILENSLLFFFFLPAGLMLSIWLSEYVSYALTDTATLWQVRDAYAEMCPVSHSGCLAPEVVVPVTVSENISAVLITVKKQRLWVPLCVIEALLLAGGLIHLLMAKKNKKTAEVK